ncbi:class I SAM-dependent methyltransferase [Anaerocolumna xylanovorans]|uniref:Methyltransferase domain-containing protein n=1 Tax=Anaerocolumna xylanovorans DSM 12503 TaxID=1121345 RepID=A0A1M7YA46_9FIRM|nr:SAM-dependent methyltransferase [Anaerocolumna xylanovorans]SHO49408.1 Methyltransferase domain-containing protein [Anaerocolumna xylanovorans DSM 12503]
MEGNNLSIIGENLNIDFIDMIISNPVKGKDINKITVRPVTIKGKELYQVCEYRNNQVFHKNVDKDTLIGLLDQWMGKEMKQLLLRTGKSQVTLLVSSKGKETLKVKQQKAGEEKAELQKSTAHNREKVYIIQEGTFVPFLFDLGVITKEGKIVKDKYDKFRQINRFLEFVEDVLPALKKDKELTVLDFGCGKSYLTFAMYYYLKTVKGYSVRIIGLDLKKEVIANCNALAQKYGYDRLNFLTGDIADYEGINSVDMVVTLHACDTATDYALYKAIKWGAQVILSVPCCQHELNKQINNEILNPILQYGLIKERIAALATDGLRAELLEAAGYKTQILEFIDMEHTPKNILIRGVKRNDSDTDGKTGNRQIAKKLEEIDRLMEFLQVSPKLYELFRNHLPQQDSEEVDIC